MIYERSNGVCGGCLTSIKIRLDQPLAEDTTDPDTNIVADASLMIRLIYTYS